MKAKELYGNVLNGAIKRQMAAEAAARAALRAKQQEELGQQALTRRREEFEALKLRNMAIVEHIAEVTDGGPKWGEAVAVGGIYNDALLRARVIILGRTPVSAVTPDHTTVAVPTYCEEKSEYSWVTPARLGIVVCAAIPTFRLPTVLEAEGDPLSGVELGFCNREESYVEGTWSSQNKADLSVIERVVYIHGRKDRHEYNRTLANCRNRITGLEDTLAWVGVAAQNSELNAHLPVEWLEDPTHVS